MTMLMGFPGAGAGKNVFEIWQDRLKDEIEFREILHNRRFTDTICQTMNEAAERCVKEVLSVYKEEEELYFYGHCMGANVAYETAKRLAKDHGIQIRGLFFSAFISPDVPIEDGISHLDDNAFAEEIHSHGTFPEEFFVKPALLKLFLPKIKADYRLIEAYCDSEHYVLDCPFAGFFGTEDDSVTQEEIRGWGEYTSREFLKFYFPGDHYFYYDHQEEIIDKIKELIREFRSKETGKQERDYGRDD